MSANKSYDSLLKVDKLNQSVSRAKPNIMMARGIRVKIKMDGIFDIDKDVGVASNYTGFLMPLSPSGSAREKLLAARWDVKIHKPWTEMRIALQPFDTRFSTESFHTTIEFNLLKLMQKPMFNIFWQVQHKAAYFYAEILNLLEEDIDSKIGIPLPIEGPKNANQNA